MTIGENIRKARKAAGLTQKELGEKIGIKAGTVSAFEKDKTNIKPSTLEKFADALNIPVSVLLDDDLTSPAIKAVIDRKTEMMKAITESSSISVLQKINWDEQRKINLDTYYESLNRKGQIEAVKRVEELTYIPDYMNEED